MKLRFGVAAALVLAWFTTPAFAQGVTGGIKGGVGFASVSVGEEDEDFLPIDRRTGFLAGGFVDVPAGEGFVISIEGLFNQKGASDSVDDFESTLKLDYVEIPILAKVPFATMSPAQPFVYAGLAPAFNVSAKVGSNEEGEDTDDIDLDEQFKSFDLGLVVGGGVRFGAVAVEARYTHGLTNISEFEGEQVGEVVEPDPDVKNRQFAVLVSIFFGAN